MEEKIGDLESRMQELTKQKEDQICQLKSDLEKAEMSKKEAIDKGHLQAKTAEAQ